MNPMIIGKPAGQDLSTHQYKAVSIAGTVAASDGAAFGIQQNKPGNGEDLAIAYAGISRYRAGGAVSANGRISVTTSGWIIAATSGDTSCGKAIEAVSSGGIGEGIFNFATTGEIV